MNDPSDNPFASFLTAVEAAYFWLSGSFPQKDSWGLASIHIITVIASFLLAIVMQNMLISLMGYVLIKKKRNFYFLKVIINLKYFSFFI